MDDALDREAQIRRYFPLVKRIARRIHRLVPSVDVDDLVGDGSIGLIRAVDCFDPLRGPSLEQYARQLIAGAMLNGIRRMDPVSERARRTLRDGESERYRIAVERGSVPGNVEMESLRPGFARASLAAHRGVPLSIDAPLPEGEHVPNDWSTDPASIIMEREASKDTQALLDRLPPRQRELMQEHYFRDHSLRDIGARMRISPQRASQLHIAALIKLRNTVHAAAR
ncbi:MAG: sigma-70 family RNA polymerase sigma factor [Candidatus Eremiobacteraeota bacterium]|nr:sigma-70 family RNA polymerase sigma factor [Candidatus Eremiobacteraeota bacterium]